MNGSFRKFKIDFKNYKKYLPITLVLVSAVFFMAAVDDYYAKINKSFDIYGSIMKELTNNYVVEFDPEDLVEESIDGMLKKLDPYTVYYNSEDAEDLSMLSSGQYTGLGITVAQKNGMITIIGIHAGYPAEVNGLRVGDRLYSIDDVVVINKDTKELREYTRGEPGSIAKIKALRDGAEDTIKVTITRETIKLDNVSYTGILENNFGYIKLDRFTSASSNEVRMAIHDLKAKANIKGLVFDLRDNPGGLLDAAIDIVELFVPKGSLIVSTKGRGRIAERKYISKDEPMEPNLPLTVLINEYSASASEIVAGAIQDLDRGVIIGKRSFGKGLVQSVIDLPYDGSLKITTAKYYTPSGRSIQKVDYEKNLTKSEGWKESDVFYTANKRKVYEHDGITPDSSVGERTYSDFTRDLFVKDMIFNFANEYTSKLKNMSESILEDDILMDNFTKYLVNKKYEYNSPSINKINELEKLVNENEKSGKIINQINSLKSSLNIPLSEYLKNNRNEVITLLEEEVVLRFHDRNFLLGRSLKDDNVVGTAINLMKSKRYKDMLLTGEIKNKEH